MREEKFLIPDDEKTFENAGFLFALANNKSIFNKESLDPVRKSGNGDTTNSTLCILANFFENVLNQGRINAPILKKERIDVVNVAGDFFKIINVHFDFPFYLLIIYIIHIGITTNIIAYYLCKIKFQE